MNKCSVIILNYSRPEYLKKNILPYLSRYKNIDQIIISHGKKSSYFDSSKISSKILDLEDWDKNKEYGLTLRFLAAEYSSNPNIIIMDDDILPTEETVNNLITNINKDENIYGLYGRMLDKNFKYNTSLYFGQCHIVLTRCLITTKEMCKYFIDNYKLYEYQMVKESKPFWNGEDILFNLLSIKKTDKFPIALCLSHNNKNALAENLFSTTSISKDNTHIQYRQKLTQKLINDMFIKEKLKENKNNKKHSNWFYEFYNSDLLFYSILLILLIIFLYLIFSKKIKRKIIKNERRYFTNRDTD